MKQRSYEDREGVKRTVYELDVEEVGASLKNATAKVTKTTGRGGQGGYGGGGGGGQQGGGWGGGSGGGQQGGGGAPRTTPGPPALPPVVATRAAVAAAGAEAPAVPAVLAVLAAATRTSPLLGLRAEGGPYPHFLITQEKHHGEAACAQA